jgi:hypothetical protein
MKLFHSDKITGGDRVLNDAKERTLSVVAQISKPTGESCSGES